MWHGAPWCALGSCAWGSLCITFGNFQCILPLCHMAFAILFIFFTCFISSLVRILCFLYFHTSPRPFSNQLPKATVEYVCPSARSKEQNIQTAVCKLIAPPFSTSSQVMCLIHSYEPFKWLCVFSFVSGWDHMRHKHKPNWEDNKQQSSWIFLLLFSPWFCFCWVLNSGNLFWNVQLNSRGDEAQRDHCLYRSARIWS